MPESFDFLRYLPRGLLYEFVARVSAPVDGRGTRPHLAACLPRLGKT